MGRQGERPPSRELSRYACSVTRFAALIALLGAASACGNPQQEGDGPEAAGQPSGAEMRVLFIGNSLTYANDLPGMVQALAAGSSPVDVSMVASPNFSLDDHRASGDAIRAIAGGRWDFVVLQQGPSSLPESRQQLRASVVAFADEIRRAGARPALYMVWPSADRAGDFERSSESYALAAADVDGVLLPAGDAWRAAWRRDSSLPLYGADGFHPSPTGSYLAALAVYSGLLRTTSIGLPASIRTRSGQAVEVAPPVARVLQESADEAIAARMPEGATRPPAHTAPGPAAQ
jgi:hypothetical protein